MLSIENVSKRFGRTQALSGFSVTARAGEILGLLGPNGAGKTTAIRLTLNIYVPDSGSITFDGEPFSPAIRERIGYLPEERGIYPKEKLRETLIYLSSLKGTPRATAIHVIDQWLERFGLLEHAEAKVESLSKGMHHKAQFIAAVAHDPDIVVLDEPFSGLDPVSVETVRNAILDLKEAGKTIVFSTHVVDQAEKLCNRIAIVDQGRLVLCGPLSEVKRMHGSRSVQVEFDGDGAFIDELPQVEEAIRYPRYVEILLRKDVSAQSLLLELASRLQITRFEVLSPSLHHIFLEKIGTAHGEYRDPVSGGEDSQ
jgi:ABC-2 type transport system ATP-binding protein